MKNKASLKNKIYRKLHWILFSRIKPGAWIHSFYPAYRHGKKYQKRPEDKGVSVPDGQENGTVYLTQIPNEGAGIGHQIANYIGGVHYAQIFHVPHAYSGFKDAKWDAFLGFGEGETTVAQLKKQGYQMHRLPYFDETADAKLIRDIIASYQGQKVILLTELDQFYQKQYEVIPHIKEKFESAQQRKTEGQVYDRAKLHIAVHIRRGDIVRGQKTGEETLVKRWLTTEYYENAVKDVIRKIREGSLLPEEDGRKEIVLHLFSQGNPEDYRQFEQFAEVDYCLDKGAMESFLMMVRADVLILSKSSFSYKPALLADGIRICPPDFWHGYPEDPLWIVAEEDGHLA